MPAKEAFHLWVTGHFCLCAGGTPDQRPWSLSRDGFMLVGIRAGSPLPSNKSLVGVGFITRAAVPGGHAFWEYDVPFCFGFPDDLGLTGSSLLGLWSAQAGERGSTDFALVLVASWKGPEPHVAEPIPVRLI